MKDQPPINRETPRTPQDVLGCLFPSISDAVLQSTGVNGEIEPGQPYELALIDKSRSILLVQPHAPCKWWLTLGRNGAGEGPSHPLHPSMLDAYAKELSFRFDQLSWITVRPCVLYPSQPWGIGVLPNSLPKQKQFGVEKAFENEIVLWLKKNRVPYKQQRRTGPGILDIFIETTPPCIVEVKKDSSLRGIAGAIDQLYRYANGKPDVTLFFASPRPVCNLGQAILSAVGVFIWRNDMCILPPLSEWKTA